MKVLYLDLQKYMPLIVAIVSSILAFVFGKSTEKKKRFVAISDEVLSKTIGKMYKELIYITEVQNYDVKKIKLFILKYSGDENIYKIYDDEIIFSILDLSIKLRNNTILKDELKREFNKIAINIQNLFWDTLKANTTDYKWWKNKRALSRFYTIPMGFVFILKDVSEYLMVIIAFLCAFVTLDLFFEKQLFSSDLRILTYYFGIIIVLLYFAILLYYFWFENKRGVKRKKIIKQLK